MSALYIKRALVAGMAGVATTLQTGCIGPYHFSHSMVYRGRVVDAETQSGLADAKAELHSTLSMSSKSDAGGYFVVGPLRCSHFGIRVPPEGYLPQCQHSVGMNIALKLSKFGYRPLEVLVPAATDTNWTSELEVGTFALHREPGASK
jgi:hypothetical protein